MVEHPDAWKWSSYRARSGKEEPHPCLTIDWVLGQFSSKRDKARKEYQQFMKWGIGEASIWKDVKSNHELASKDINIKDLALGPRKA